MTGFEKLELAFIIIELISIFIEIGLQIYEIKSSKDMEKLIMKRFDKLEDIHENRKNNNDSL